MTKRWPAWLVLALLVQSPATPSFASPAPENGPWAVAAPLGATSVDRHVIEIWVRGTNARGVVSPTRSRSRKFDLDRLPLTNVHRYDTQYDRVATYRGISLRELLRRFSPAAQLDLAILHFGNGMAVPIPFRDRVAMNRLDPFIARAPKPQRSSAARTFPTVRIEGGPSDRRSIDFGGNKIVVADRWHPEVSTAAESDFSPWARVDTLVSVELVASKPYYAQFDIGDTVLIRRGLALYRESCQFCHGARHVGASFGWDFVESPPIYDYQNSAANLYHNVAYKPRNGTELGLLMPALRFMTEEQAGYLQRWLQAIATRPMPPYEPPRNAF
jgi:mono/diheme cytochrome c family protein